MHINVKTNRQHWDDAWVIQPHMRLPSGLFVGTRNIQKLLKNYITPGMHVLEIGCAPGKILAWVAKTLRADVSGIDFSVQGMDNARRLFERLRISGHLLCEDIFETTFQEGSFDFVFSCGVIEHFEDPKQLIEIHAKLLKPGGKAVIAIPRYAGIYFRLQNYFDAHNLSLHNLHIMSPSSLAALAPRHLVKDVRCYPTGRMMSTLINFNKKLPKWLALGLTVCFNTIGLIQPFDISNLCPLIVLEMTKENDSQKLYREKEVL